MTTRRPVILALVSAALALPALARAQSPAPLAEARVIVRFKTQADSVRAKALSARATRGEAREVAQNRATALGLRTGHRLSAGLSLDERTHVVTARGLSGAELARKLAADPEVELVAVDQRRKALALPNDPLFGGAAINAETTSGGIPARVIDQWYLKKPAGAVVSSINAPDTWDLTTGSSSVIVAVIDTGVRTDHPDLAGKLVAGYDFIGFGSPGSVATAVANDGNGPDADASDPGDWVSQADVDGGALGTGCISDDITNSSWHGTRVSGLIGAKTDNGQGMAGVGWGLKILPVRVLGKCGGYDSDIMAGMKWAAGLAMPGLPANPNKAKVLNLSLGGAGACGTSGIGGLYRDTISQVNAAGSTVVVAAGNSEGQAVGLPGNCPGVISVAALRHVGTKVGFSSVGPEVTIAAPGGNCINTLNSQPCLYPMVSTTNHGTTAPIPADEAYTGSGASVGTSFSAPIVSGIVGLMASIRPSLTATEATQILKSTARPFATTGGGSSANPAPPVCAAPSSATQDECYCTTSTCGAGMVDALAAVKAAQALNTTTIAITQSPASGLTAGQTLSLTAAASGLASGRTVASTAWTLVDGGGIATAFTSGANTATATITPTAAGSFTVRADITDNLGLVYSQTATVSVAAAAPGTPPPSSSGGGGGGGGGSLSAAWLAALLAAALTLMPRKRPAPQRCRP